MNKNKNTVVPSGGCVSLGIVTGTKCLTAVACVLATHQVVLDTEII